MVEKSLLKSAQKWKTIVWLRVIITFRIFIILQSGFLYYIAVTPSFICTENQISVGDFC